MLAWVVISRRHLRQSPQLRFIPASPWNLQLFTFDLLSRLTPTESYRLPTPPSNPFGIISFQKRCGEGILPTFRRWDKTCGHSLLILASLPHYLLTSSSLRPLAATLMNLPASVANKRLTAQLNLLDATLTKNTGAGQQLWLTKR
jgi:hypothetical protein